MISQPKLPKSNKIQHQQPQSSPAKTIEITIAEKIDKLSGLEEYNIRELIQDAQNLGTELAKSLKTNQIRKFLDSIKQISAKLNQNDYSLSEINSEVQLLRPKLAYAAGRHSKKGDSGSIGSLQTVLEVAIRKVRSEPENFEKDFSRLTQLIESIIAYHKAAGGQNQ